MTGGLDLTVLRERLAGQPQVYLLAHDGPGLVDCLGTGTYVERTLTLSDGPVAVLRVTQGYAPWQRRWLEFLGRLADERTFSELEAAIAAAQARDNHVSG